MWPPKHRNSNSNPMRFDQIWIPLCKLFLTAQVVNPWFPLHMPIFEEESFPYRLTSRYSEVCYAFAVKGFCALFSAQCSGFCLVMTFNRYYTVSWLHFPSVCSAETNLTLIRPSPKFFVCNLPDSGRHVTRPNQGLSTGRRENLGTRLH